MLVPVSLQEVDSHLLRCDRQRAFTGESAQQMQHVTEDSVNITQQRRQPFTEPSGGDVGNTSAQVRHTSVYVHVCGSINI